MILGSCAGSDAGPLGTSRPVVRAWPSSAMASATCAFCSSIRSSRRLSWAARSSEHLVLSAR